MHNYYLIRKLIFSISIIFMLLYELKAEDNQISLLNKLDKVFPAEIFFNQINNNNEKVEGWMLIGGKGLARIEFAPPNNLIMVANGKWLIVHDVEFDRTTYVPLDRGILGALLNPMQFNKEKKLNVVEKKNENRFFYTITSENFLDSELRIFFGHATENIKGWELLENGILNIKVEVVKINNLKSIENYDENIFKFTNSMRASNNSFLGPYKRKLKIIPKNKPN